MSDTKKLFTDLEESDLDATIQGIKKAKVSDADKNTSGQKKKGAVKKSATKDNKK